MFKVNEYFDGTVKSIAFAMNEGPAPSASWLRASTSSAPPSWK